MSHRISRKKYIISATTCARAHYTCTEFHQFRWTFFCSLESGWRAVLAGTTSQSHIVSLHLDIRSREHNLKIGSKIFCLLLEYRITWVCNIRFWLNLAVTYIIIGHTIWASLEKFLCLWPEIQGKIQGNIVHGIGSQTSARFLNTSRE